VSKKLLCGDDSHEYIHKINNLCCDMVLTVEKIRSETEHYIMRRLEEEKNND